MNYIILDNPSSSGLMKTIEVFIELGWQPQGGLAIYKDIDEENIFAQAMVKYPNMTAYTANTEEKDYRTEE